MPEPIDVAGIPGADLRPDQVDRAATEMSAIGEQVSTQAAVVVSTWQQLSGVYDAPEDTLLLGALDPVRTDGETFRANIAQVASALHTYAAEVEPIKAELARIKADAKDFLGSIIGGVEQQVYVGHTSTVWHQDQDSVDANNALIGRVDAQMGLLMAAERRCANAIYDIMGFPHRSTGSGGRRRDGRDPREGAPNPWGTPVERTEPCGQRFITDTLWEGVVVNSIWGSWQSAGSLVLGYNPRTGEYFDPAVYGAAVIDLGLLGIGAATHVAPGMDTVLTNLPGPVGDVFRQGQQRLDNFSKDLIAYDMWEVNPFTAAGMAGFNIISILVPSAAATTAVRNGTTPLAGAARATARALDLTDPMAHAVRIGGAAGRAAAPTVDQLRLDLDLGRVTDLFNAAANDILIDIPAVSPSSLPTEVPTVAVPDMAVTTPRGAADLDIPVRSESGHPGFNTRTTPSGLTVAERAPIEPVHLDTPYPDADIQGTPSGLHVVQRSIEPVQFDTPYPDPVLETTPSGPPVVDRTTRRPTPEGQEESASAAGLEALRDSFLSWAIGDEVAAEWDERRRARPRPNADAGPGAADEATGAPPEG